MVKQKIHGRTCTIVFNFPKYLDEKTKDVLVNIFGYCLDEESKEKVLDAVENLMAQTKKLINSIKKSGKQTTNFEMGIREFVGVQLNHGFAIGSSYSPGEDGEELIDVLADKFDYGRLISGAPKSKRDSIQKVFGWMDLAVLAFETGLMLSYYLSEELVEQNQKELRKATSYIQ